MSQLDELLEEGRKEEEEQLQAVGADRNYNDWRESLPNERIPDEAVLDTFMHLTDMESAAQQGQLNVLIGGVPVDDIATTPPGRGPDDQEGRPDEAGDTTDDATMEAPEGMWMPPKEAEAENYEPPTTDAIKKDPEWIKNAKIFHELIDGPIMETDEDLSDWAANQMSLFNWNLMATMAYAQKVTSADDPKLALAFLNLLNMYDHSDGGYKEFGKALGGLATDPTTYFGAGVGAVAAKGAARATAKAGLKKAVQLAIIGGSAGATEGSLLAGGFNLAKQNIEQEAGAREDIDYGQAGLSAAAGGSLGVLLGGGGGALAGRYIDKLLAGAEAELTRQLGGKKRRVSDLTIDEFRNSLEASARASEAEGRRDRVTEMLLKGLEGDDLPRDPKTGELDIDKYIEDMLGNYDPPGSLASKLEVDEDNTFNFRHGEDFDPDTEDGAKIAEQVLSDLEITSLEAGVVDFALNTWSDGAQDVTSIRFSNAEDAAKFRQAAREFKVANDLEAVHHETGKPGRYEIYDKDGNLWSTWESKAEAEGAFNALEKAEGEAKMVDTQKQIGGKPVDPVPMSESEKLKQRVLEMDELQKGEVILRTPNHRGSTIRNIKDSGLYELLARNKQGWYKAVNKVTGEEVNLRRNQFDVVDKAPAPSYAGPMSLDPFSEDGARLIKMAEDVSGRKLKDQVIPHSVHRDIVKSMKEMGINILEKDQMSYWTPAELMWLRDTYNAQAVGMAEIIRKFEPKMRNEGLTDADLAFFNSAHTQFMATRDLFYGISGNAARQLNILKTRPTKEIYDFADALRNDIGIGGGRVNTERTIMNMFEAIKTGGANESAAQKVAKANQTLWDSRVASALLITRYNLMLSSWRTHFYNFLGNSVSGLYHHLLVSPIGGAINNVAYASKLAYSKIPGTKVELDPASRWTFNVYGKEIQAHFQSAMDSLILAKEIALGRDIGEGKIWNELGLRYDVVNVPNSMFGKIGTTPVRMLEAGDAFFKNQYYNSHLYGIAARKARQAQLDDGVNFDAAFQEALDNITPRDMQDAKDFAAKMTYTNDPNVYQNIFGVLADGLNRIQLRDKSLTMNMLMPFIRTPANLISYSIDMTGLNAVIPGFGMQRTYRDIIGKDPVARQEALAKLTAAVGIWYTVYQLHQEGRITGTGPVNWEEVEAWKAAGWQPNSIKIGDKWYDTARAAPGGRALNMIASIMDYSTLNHNAREEDQIGWTGAGLLYLADNMIDESFMSTIADTITAVQAKNTGRSQSVLASTVNSVFVPNLLRDIRRVSDKTIRSSTSPDIGTQILNQMKNATPGLSDQIPPRRDWKGDPVNYYGNAYYRAVVPFAVRDSQETDPASMAIAYARLAPSKPDKRISMPGGHGNFIDLFAMDNGKGYVYDKYVETVGKARHDAVVWLMNKARWKRAVAEGNIGPGSDGERMLRKALAEGSAMGRLQMIEWLQDHSGENNTFKRANGDTVMIHHTFTVQEYKQLVRMVRKENIPVPDDKPQYDLLEQEEGPEFFKP